MLEGRSADSERRKLFFTEHIDKKSRCGMCVNGRGCMILISYRKWSLLGNLSFIQFVGGLIGEKIC
jgi:hypothetical protein